MQITALITIASSHIVAYELDNKDLIWIAELKNKLQNSNINIKNVELNKFNHIVVEGENNLPQKEIDDIFYHDIMIFNNTKQTPPAYYNQAIFQYDYNGKPMKIDPKFYYDFQQNGYKFKPLIYNKKTLITEMRFLFKNISIESIDVSNLDTSNITDMTGMFNYSACNSINLSTFDTSNVTTMRLMFSQCNFQKLDLSTFNMLNVMDISRMFANATIAELILPRMSIQTLTSADELFEYSEIGVLNLSAIDLSTISNIKALIKLLFNCKTRISTIVYKNAHDTIDELLTSDWSNI